MDPKSPQGPERRQHRRVSRPKVLLRIPTVDRLRSQYLKDLSGGGAFIRIAQPLPVGAVLRLEIEAPWLEGALELPATVVRSVPAEKATADEPAGMGVRFDELDADTRARLQQLLESHGSSTELESTIFQESANVQSALEEPKGTSELERTKTGSDEVRSELAEARRRICELEEQLKTLEQDEATTRMLADKLAAEKSRSEAALREQVESLEAALAEAQAQGQAQADWDAERSQLEADRASARLEVQAASLRAQQLEDALKAQQRAAQASEKRLMDLQNDFERLKRREAALRHMLSVVSNANLTQPPEGLTAEVEVPVEEAAVQAPAPVEAAAPPVPAEPPEPLAVQSWDLPPPSEQTEAQASEADADLPIDEAPEAVAAAAATEALVSGGEDVPEFDVEIQTSRLKRPALMLESFTARLENGALLKATPALHEQKELEASEKMVAAMLESPQGLNELLEKASAYPVKDQFVRHLHTMHWRGLIDIESGA